MDSADDSRACAARATKEGNLRRCCGATYYCSVASQKANRKSHKKVCENTNFSKSKKATTSSSMGVRTSKELAIDDGLDSFRDEEPYVDLDNFEFPPRDDCPVCMCPFPIDNRQIEFMLCCGQTLCNACSANATNPIERNDDVDTWSKCVFCRSLRMSGPEMMDAIKSRDERGDAKPTELSLLAGSYENGRNGLPINYQRAVELYHRAARLGSADAAHTLGCSYMNGDIVRMDRMKARRLLSRAAKGGSVGSMNNLGCMEFRDMGEDHNLLFVEYFTAAAKGGWKDSMKSIQSFHEHGLVSDDDFKSTLSAHIEVLKREQTDHRDRYNLKEE